MKDIVPLYRLNYRRSGAVCLALILTILVAGLWPFNFFPKNKVEWLSDRNGVHFYGQGMITSAGPWQESGASVFPDQSVSLEIWLHPLAETSNLPCLLTLYDGKRPDIFLVGQWKSHLVIRSRIGDPEGNKYGKPYQEIGIKNALMKNQDVFITVTSEPEGTAVYIDGVLSKSYPRLKLLSGHQGGPCGFVLGNSPTGESYWTGYLLGFAVYKDVLASDRVSAHYRSWLKNDFSLILQNTGLIGLYPFSERKGTVVRNHKDANSGSLSIPETFKPVQRRVLEPPWIDFRLDSSFIWDITVNILGFIPLGFFLSAFLLNLHANATAKSIGQLSRWYGEKSSGYKYFNYYAVILAGLGLSLSIELIQVYLPTRYSQLSDVICNVAGTILGLIIYHLYEKRSVTT